MCDIRLFCYITLNHCFSTTFEDAWTTTLQLPQPLNMFILGGGLCKCSLCDNSGLQPQATHRKPLKSSGGIKSFSGLHLTGWLSKPQLAESTPPVRMYVSVLNSRKLRHVCPPPKSRYACTGNLQDHCWELNFCVNCARSYAHA